jgi:hypothetical protein
MKKLSSVGRRTEINAGGAFGTVARSGHASERRERFLPKSQVLSGDFGNASALNRQG